MNWVLTICLLGAAFFTGFTYFSSKNLDRPSYKVIKKDGNFEVREYKSSLWAEVKVSNRKQEIMSREGFRPLANYIFGGNKENIKMSMTAPVAMIADTSIPSVRFFMPPDRSMQNLPEPNQKNIDFIKLPKRTLATLSFGGNLNEQSKLKSMKSLKDWCDDNKFTIIGPLEVFGYNAPYEVIKTNEVAFPIKN
jgi:hypothetical protein